MAEFILNEDGSFTQAKKKKKKQKDKYEEVRNATFTGQSKTRNQPKDSEWYQKILKKPEAFDDGYQFGDITKTALGTAGDIASTATKATWQNVYDIGMNIAGGVYTGLDKIGILPGASDAFADIERYNQDVAVVSDIDKGVDKLNKATRDNSVLGDFSKDTLQSAIQSAENALISKASGLPMWQVNSLATGYRNEYVNALNNGATKEQATASGLASGISEVLSEYLFSGFIKLPGTGSGIDTALGKATEKIGSNFLKTVAQYGINVGGEAFEEVLSGFGSALGQKLTYLKDTEFKDIYSLEDALENAGAGALSAMFGSANPRTIQNIREGRNLVTGLTGTQQKYVDEIAQQRMVEAEKRNAKLNLIQKGKINQRTMTDFEKGRLADSSKLSQVNLPGITNKDLDLQQSAYKYRFNPNSEAIVTAKTMLDNRGIKSRFDAEAFKGSNENSFWTKKSDGTREVVFNPNASEQTILEEIAIHELTHDLMSSKNSKDIINNQKIMNYVSKLNGYKEARANVEKLYAEKTKGMTAQQKADYINEEIVADTLGQNIGSQEYIRRLIDDEPSVAKKIYDWVVNKVTNSKGVKNEKAYWNNVKNNFEKAYNMEYQSKGKQSDTKYSIGGIKAIRSLKESDYKEKALNAYDKAIKMQQSGKYSNEEIRKATKWFQDKNGDWKFEFDDSSIALKSLSISKNNTYKLGDVIEHKMLDMLYPELKEIDVVFTNMDANGSFNKKYNRIRINNKFLDNVNYKELKGTLLHEIQHAIQAQEGFENGKSSKIFKKAYYESLGEIEADDTKQRYMKDYSMEDRREKAPKSSLKNPKHSQYNNYIKNRKLIDKALDGIYNIVERGANSAEKTKKNYSEDSHETSGLVDGRGLLDNSSFSMSEQLEKQANEVAKKEIAERQAMIELFEDYLSENDITNPTEQDIYNSLDAYDVYDANESFDQEGQKKYFDTIKKYLKEQNQDVRYSLTDNQGRKLTKGQQEYFKDSKVRDEDGNLLAVYHGSNSKFTVFDIGKSGESNKTAKVGFWFTESRNGAENFANSTWYGDNNPTTFEVYLNIKNPKIYESKDNSQQIEEINKQINIIKKERETLKDKYEYGKASFQFVKTLKEVYKKSEETILQEKGYNDSQIKEYIDDLNKYNDLYKEIKKLETKKMDLRYGDSYEQFRTDIYKIAGQTAEDANLGGIGMTLNNQNEVMKQFKQNLIDEGYDGIVIKNTRFDTDTLGAGNNQYVAFEPNQIKNVDNTNPTDDADIRFAKQNALPLDKNFEAKGTKTRLSDIKLPGLTKAVQEEVQKQTSNALLPIANELKELNKNLTKVMNPSEISQLTPQDANTTPILPGVNRNKVGDGKSKFFDNINEKTNMLNDEQKTAILSNDDVKYYDKVTNKESLDKAYARLQENGQSESYRWFNKASENADATDVAEGWILLKQYADSGDTNGMVEVAKKLREMGTKAGQTVQAFNILSRLTPEGMVKYAQSELLEAYDQMVKNKSKAWIDANRDKFDLKPNEVAFIMDTMKDVSTMPDGYDKRFKLAQIQKVMTDKLPPSKGAGIKAWMRISMLFNPKTQVRNVAGNALIAPVNAFGDMFASLADKAIGSKTGVRTTGNFNLKDYTSGMKKGLYESYNDFKNGVNTRNIEGNRFEITEGKSFNDKNIIGKSLNRVDNLLSFMLDAGDRGFYEASFVNSINNQMVLNNTTEVTQDMIDIATQEALSRTWQDNNEYTKFVLNIRNNLNKATIAGYGLGDILIPFAKTPANLTKALVDYSPAGLIGTINKGIKLNRSLTNGQYSAKTQHEFVQSLGKATAGTMLYVLGFALANAGITSGESDEDKDVSNFLKNTLGINSYSIKIGDKSFTYDWAQPLAGALSITANLVQKQKEDATLLENVISTLDTAGNLLLEQSFMESISTVLNNNEGIATGLQEAVLDLPARAVPTLFKQVTDLTDGTQRQTFVKGKPVESMVNSIKAKLPGLSQTLSPSVDTLGREIQKYGGKNNLFNVFLNPANVNTENVSESAQEIYRLYKETGETNIMPRVAPYYVNKKGEKINLTAQQRTEYQKISGSIIETNVANLLNSSTYKNMSDANKAEVINNIVNYSYNIAQNQVLGTELSKDYVKAYEYSQIGDISDYYEFRNSIDDTNSKTERESVFNYLYNSDLDDNQIAKLYRSCNYSTDKTINAMLELRIPMKEFVKYDTAEIEGKYNPNTGKTISGSKKNAIIEYVNGLNLSKAQKAILIKGTNTFNFDTYNNDIIRYINTLNGSVDEKKVLLKSIGFDNYDRDVVRYIKSQGLSQEETEKKLEDLGFTIRDGRVYY